MKALLGRLGAFAIIPALSLVTPLLVLPVVSRTAGGEGIVAMAVGQSIGGVASVVVALSWPLLGAAAVAVASHEERLVIYEDSLIARSIAFFAIVPFVLSMTVLAVPSHLGSAIIAAIAISAYGFSATWFYAGIGRPRNLILLEVVPRVSASAFAASALALGAPLIVYPLLLLTAALASLFFVSRSVLGRLPTMDWRRGLRIIRATARATVARGVNGLYNAGLTVTVAVVAPKAALLFTATDRVQKSAFNSLTLVPEALVGWVAESSAHDKPRRVVRAISIDFVVASAAALLVVLCLPLIFAFLYANEVTATTDLRLVSGLVVFLLVLARGTLLHAVVALGRDRAAASIVMVASMFGLPLVALGAVAQGAVGALLGVGAAEAGVCLAAVVSWLLLRHRDRDASTGSFDSSAAPSVGRRS